MSEDKAQGMKSAYELALERMEQQGIERPREDSLSDQVREEMAEVRRRADAKVAEFEILHQDRLAKMHDPVGREEELENFRRDKQRAEEDRDRKLARLREGK
jgi:hypothetical protein